MKIEKGGVHLQGGKNTQQKAKSFKQRSFLLQESIWSSCEGAYSGATLSTVEGARPVKLASPMPTMMRDSSSHG